jgi:hypothetical protein
MQPRPPTFAVAVYNLERTVNVFETAARPPFVPVQVLIVRSLHHTLQFP